MSGIKKWNGSSWVTCPVKKYKAGSWQTFTPTIYKVETVEFFWEAYDVYHRVYIHLHSSGLTWRQYLATADSTTTSGYYTYYTFNSDNVRFRVSSQFPRFIGIEEYGEFDSYYTVDHPYSVYDFIQTDGVEEDIDNIMKSSYDLGSYGSTCLNVNSLITLSDGSDVLLENLKMGDKVRCINPSTLQYDEDTVVGVGGKSLMWTDRDDHYFSDGTVVSTVMPHRLYNIENQRMMYIEDWTPGEHAYRMDGLQIEYLRSEHIEEETYHKTVFTEKYNNYFVNGVMAGNRLSTEIHL